MLTSRAFFYILKAIFLPFMMCLLTFFSLIFVFQFLQNSHLFFQDSSSLNLVLQIFTLLGVSYLPLVLPFCLLFGILFGHGRLSNQSEFTAFASFGISKLQLAQPAFVFSIICTLICLNSIHTWGPNAKFKSRSLEYVLKKKIASTAFQPGVFLTQIPGLTIYAESEDSDKKLTNILIVNEDSNPYEIFAQSGRFTKESDSSNLGINLYDGSIYNNIHKDQTNLIIDFKKYFIQLFKSQQSTYTKKYINNRTSKQLRRMPAKDPETENKINIELKKRNTFALSCLLFFVLGSLFSLRLHNRSSKGSGLFLAILIAMLFWITVFVSEFFAGSLRQSFLMYLPILIYSLLCFVVYKWTQRKSVI